MRPPARPDDPFVRSIELVLAAARRPLDVELLADYFRLFEREPDLERLLAERGQR